MPTIFEQNLAAKTDQNQSVSERLQSERDADAALRKRESFLSRGITEMTGLRRPDSAVSNFAVSGTTADMLRSLEQHKKDRLWEQDVAEYGTGLLKTAALFIPGKAATVATAAIYAFDEIKPGSSTSEMVADATLGAAKGLATRGILHWTQARGLAAGESGIVIGGMSRLSDSALTRSNYFDNSGNFSLGKAFDTTAKNTLNPLAMASDYAVFSMSHGALKYADKLSGGSVSASPFWRNVVTGQSMGMSSGFIGESMRQWHEGEFDPMRIAKISLAKGMLDGIAAMPGGYLAGRGSKPAFTELEKPAETTLRVTETPLRVTREIPLVETEIDNVHGRKMTMNVYDYKSISIAVPQEYDAQVISPLRQWRATATGEMPADHPLYQFKDRATPEDVARTIDGFPKPELVSRVRLLNEVNPKDPNTAALSNADGEINLYKARNHSLFGEDMLHEWWHMVKWQNPELSNRFDDAAKLEQDGHFVNDYAKKGGADENWAVHGAEELANADLSRAEAFAQNAPIRSAIMLKALQESLRGSKQSDWTSVQENISRNVQKLLPETLQQARRTLVEDINTGADQNRVQSATNVLLELGGKEDFAAITKTIPRLDFKGQALPKDGLDKLAELAGGVKDVDLSTARFPLNSLSKLAGARGLEVLRLERASISDYDVGEIARSANPALRELHLSGNYRITGASVPKLSQVTDLRLLDLRRTGMTADNVAQLQEALPNTEILHD